jgi:hypothetical protein
LQAEIPAIKISRLDSSRIRKNEVEATFGLPFLKRSRNPRDTGREPATALAASIQV